MPDDNNDIQPENAAETLRKRVDAAIKATNPARRSQNLATTYVDWVADQVDGSLEQVVDVVAIELLRLTADQFEASRPPRGQHWKVWAANRLRLNARGVERHMKDGT